MRERPFGCSSLHPAVQTTRRSTSTAEDLPPYVRLEHDHVVGIAAHVVHCVMAQLGRPYEITVLPWERAQVHVRERSADAFFLSRRSVLRDDYAVSSGPIAPQN